jgi:hypothetical protein
MNFKPFSQAVEAKFNEMSEHQLYVVDVDKEYLWNLYLAAFPDGTNNILKERREYDCNCCKNFIRDVGNVVAIIDSEVISIWDVEVEHPYNEVSKELSEYVKSKPVKSVFFNIEKRAGIEQTIKLNEDNSTTKYNHFVAHIPNKYVKQNRSEVRSGINSAVKVFTRGLDELAPSAFETVIDLIEADSLYRGEEHMSSVKEFFGLQKKYYQCKTNEERNVFIWENYKHRSIRFRNTVIGTLITDLTDGVDMEKAVASFEAKVAPANYKRTSALITPRMISDAMKTVETLGIGDSLKRRHAKTDDVSINNVIYADRNTQALMKDGDALTELLMQETQVNVDEKNAREMKIEDIEAMVHNNQLNNLMSVVAPQYEDAPSILKWDNNFSWSYNNNMTDSDITSAVAALGGRVDGAFRFSHMWNYDERNASLMDLHVFMPGNSTKKGTGKEVHNNYGNEQRVGWNHRKHYASGGVQDVDYTAPAPKGKIPVENITFPSIDKLKDGEYICKIHNWNFRSPTQGGFKAEIAIGDQVFNYEYKKPLSNHEWITVATVILKDGVFTIKHHLKTSDSSIREWNIATESWTKVNMMMFSPNHWDHNQEGNKHYFFILDNCQNPDKTS